MSTASVFTGIASCAHRALIRSRGANAPPACASARIVVRREGDKPPPGFCELVPAVPSPPPCHLHRNSRSRSHPAHFASTAPPTSPHLSRAKCAGVFPPLRHSCSPSQKGEWSDECLAKRTSAFLPLDGVDLLFDEPHPGGKDNLPPSVIYIVHQQSSSFFLLTLSRLVQDVKNVHNVNVHERLQSPFVSGKERSHIINVTSEHRWGTSSTMCT